jgi:dihydroflavonol-4-reductase
MIVITGATGLLGSFIAKRFLSENQNVVGLKRKNSNAHLLSNEHKLRWREADVTDPVSLADALMGATLVVHAAALVSFDPRKENEIYRINVEGTKNIVNACLAGGTKLIHVSSVAALGRQKGISFISEDATWVDGPYNSTYAKSKMLAELEVYRGIEEGLQASIINPSYILAPADWQKSSAQIFNYVWKESRFYSGGMANYVDVEDVSEMVYQLSQESYTGERFIASAGSIPYQSLFDEIAKRFHKKSPSIKVPNSLLSLFARAEEWRSFFLGKSPLISRESVKAARENFTYSNEKAVSKLNIRFKTLEETLNRCCQYYLDTYSTKK